MPTSPATDPRIRFDDAEAYEQMMGHWSMLAGELFIDWLAPAPARHWVDVGCGNGAFTELIARRCAPLGIEGIDLSESQIAYARRRPAAHPAHFQTANAMALPFPDAQFDLAVMALVIFFVPDPAKGVAEMRRVLRPGGWAAAYVWDIASAGSPVDPISTAMRELGMSPVRPPSTNASKTDSLRTLWTDAGFEAVDTHAISVTRTFADFSTFWEITLAGSILGPQVAALDTRDRHRLEARVAEALRPDPQGRITYAAVANAIKGRLPA